MKRVLIDVNTVIPYYTVGHVSGIGRSTKELVEALSTLDGLPFRIELFTQNTRGIKTKNRISLPERHIYLPNRGLAKRIVNSIPLKKTLFGYDLFHQPNNTDATDCLSKTLFTIHDLLVYRLPELNLVSDKERIQHKYIADNCRHIVTCSQSSKDDIVHFWQIDPSKITVIPWGINRNVFYEKNDPVVLERVGVKRDFYICVSCNHPRKNLSLLLTSYRRYLHAGGQCQLVLISPTHKELFPYQDLIDQGKIIICRGISDYELCVLYTQAKASFFLSRYEGFGFPILESLACGTQVVCADNSCMREIGDNIVQYIKNPKSEDVCAKMLELDRIDKQRLLDMNQVNTHLQRFTWEACAKGYASLYADLLGKK